jgi:hypothetical protein
LDCQSHLRHWRLSRRHETKSLHTYVYVVEHEVGSNITIGSIYKSIVMSLLSDWWSQRRFVLDKGLLYTRWWVI